MVPDMPYNYDGYSSIFLTLYFLSCTIIFQSVHNKSLCKQNEMVVSLFSSRKHDGPMPHYDLHETKENFC